jgi:hypothetical protein
MSASVTSERGLYTKTLVTGKAGVVSTRPQPLLVPEGRGPAPTNNHAEQSLRLPVIFRKISFGSQSLRGAQALAKNLSLITTAKRHNRDPLELIKTILLKVG